MIITNRSLPNSEISIKLDNTYLRRVEVHKFLGVSIDHKLKFNIHIDHISNRISKSTGILYRLSQYLPISCLLNIYYALINSNLMYCNVIWGDTNDIHLHHLVMLQKKMY